MFIKNVLYGLRTVVLKLGFPVGPKEGPPNELSRFKTQILRSYGFSVLLYF